MKTLSIILLSLILISGCAGPTYQTKHGVWVFEECDNPEFEFPSKDEIEHYLDYLVENGERCLGTKKEWVAYMYRYANLHLVCESFDCILRDGSTARCAGWRRGDKYISIWGGYIWNSPIYHEFGHHLIEHLVGNSDPGHTNKWFWEDGLWCLNKPLYEASKLTRSETPPVEYTKVKGSGTKIISTYDLDSAR